MCCLDFSFFFSSSYLFPLCNLLVLLTLQLLLPLVSLHLCVHFLPRTSFPLSNLFIPYVSLLYQISDPVMYCCSLCCFYTSVLLFSFVYFPSYVFSASAFFLLIILFSCFSSTCFCLILLLLVWFFLILVVLLVLFLLFLIHMRGAFSLAGDANLYLCCLCSLVLQFIHIAHSHVLCFFPLDPASFSSAKSVPAYISLIYP